MVAREGVTVGAVLVEAARAEVATEAATGGEAMAAG